MTDNDIIKALECCKKPAGTGACKDCQYDKNRPCTTTMLEDALDLINRQKAEIERLEKVQVQYVKAYFDEFVERLKNDISIAQLDGGLLDLVIDELVETMKNEFSTLADFTDLIKAEAVKEFAEGLKKKTYPFPCAVGVENAVTVRAINEYVEEYCG